MLLGFPPVDKRGKHHYRPRKLTEEDKEHVIEHIKSFKGRKSHNGLHDSTRLYLPEELNISKMYQSYCERYPNAKCSFEKYRKIFNTKFNIGFGCPRKDTCSTCDRFLAEIGHLEKQITDALDFETNSARLVKVRQEYQDYLQEQGVFCKRKANARTQTQGSNTEYAIAFDFWKNLPCPNVTSNDVYYKRQSSVYSFNVHILTTNEVYVYFYNEQIAKKGADDVASMLYDVFTTKIPENITNLHLLCDSCEDKIRIGQCSGFSTTWLTVKNDFKASK